MTPNQNAEIDNINVDKQSDLSDLILVQFAELPSRIYGGSHCANSLDDNANDN